MNTHFCKVGNVRPNLSKRFSLKDLEEKYIKFTEDAYNAMHNDANLSDTLYHEASKLRDQILNLKGTNPNDFDAAF
ncbi:Lacal_2735 family protein [Subsaximicrobium wynnwilliamsii]|uniref:Lacal_2735 family protein n=1 Tax=Subsaximicrobium wynnwilliamsii TaxID=291179 RepID=A0A5C6ZCK0_9FLAO|nr:Lacal_2735 family protein [Subsaximicrobium wynnwilliamsii]TXD81846.1 Lacal_2735 family protein [Subsaximicrobium wynnwilliamsii]TXD87515.1 Lacal_2735 family protein [Subsaximicrobium wynnwilliamsii]TXE01198.1 Lacal_2735 family protein [Subsaximicrobium wynnwilliamsii]